MARNDKSRREFIRLAGTTVLAGSTPLLGGARELVPGTQAQGAAGGAGASANNKIQIALIGAGGQGNGETRIALTTPGVEVVAVADIYDGRLARSKEHGAKTSLPRATTARCWPAKT